LPTLSLPQLCRTARRHHLCHSFAATTMRRHSCSRPSGCELRRVHPRTTSCPPRTQASTTGMLPLPHTMTTSASALDLRTFAPIHAPRPLLFSNAHFSHEFVDFLDLVLSSSDSFSIVPPPPLLPVIPYYPSLPTPTSPPPSPPPPT
jgi:hypothetical protein